MKIAIVGAGFSGIAMAEALHRAGHDDFVVLEKEQDVGGVWHQNHYPGAACDVPSYLYSFSWAQRRDWSQPCSPQAEIQSYLRGIVRDRGIHEHLRLGVAVERATWNDDTHRWTLDLSTGESLVADAVVLGCGQLSRPAWPSIPGMDDFAGHAFHSAEWDHGHALAGRRVAVIGTGASAIQFVPPVAEEAAQLDVYQRTAPYLLPRRNPRYPSVVRAAITYVPGLQKLRRALMWGVMESFILGLTTSKPVGFALRTWSTTFMRLQIRDRELREKLWPDYAFGCKRILFSSYYLKALQRPDVEVVTDPIERIVPEGVVTASGELREVDTIVYGTGFRAGEFVTPIEVHGKGGIELQDAWAAAPIAHRGISVHGFPNLFLMYGPNTNLGVGSIVAMIEAQAGYVAQAADVLRGLPGAALEVTVKAQADSDAVVQQRFEGTAWTQCVSWYRQGGTGRVIGNWPGYMGEYTRSLRRFDHEAYEVTRRRLVPTTASAATPTRKTTNRGGAPNADASDTTTEAVAR